MATDHIEQPLLDEHATGHLLVDARGTVGCALARGDYKSDAFKKVQRRLLAALLFCTAFMIVEIVGGYIAGSIAILTDAAHLLADVSSFAVSLLAGYVAAKASNTNFSYGYHRIEVLGALASVMTVWLVTGMLVWEAVDRIRNPTKVDGRLMFILAMIGVLVNVINFFILGGHDHGHHGHGHHHHHDHGHAHDHDHDDVESHGSHDHHDHDHHDHDHHDHDNHAHHDHDGHDHAHGKGHHGNLNLRSAVVHVLGDMVQSLGVALAGALIWWKKDDPRYQIADPICTFLFAFLTLLTTRAILIDIHDILMERVPKSISIKVLQSRMLKVPGVEGVHDIHVWGLTPSIALMNAHVNLAPDADPDEALHAYVLVNVQVGYLRAMYTNVYGYHIQDYGAVQDIED